MSQPHRVSVASLLALLLPAAAAAVAVTIVAAPARAFELKYTETSFGKLVPGAARDMIVFSNDGRHVAYPARHRGAAGNVAGWVVVRDGKESAEYEWLMPRSLAFSPDSTRLAFHIQRGDRFVPIVEGVEGPAFAEIRSPKTIFSPDSKRTALIVRPAPNAAAAATTAPAGRAAGGPSITVAVDGQLVAAPAFESIHPHSLQFTPDSKDVAYVGVSADRKERWVIAGRPQPEYQFVGPIVFPPDASRHGYVAQRETGKQVLVIDGKETGQVYDKAVGLTFSPDGKRWACAAARGGKLFVVVDGVEQKPYDLVGEPLFSPHSTRVAYVAVNNATKAMCVVTDGEEGKWYDGVFEPMFSPDSKRFAFKAVEREARKMSLVLDGQMGTGFDLIRSVTFSANSASVAYAARDEGKDFMMFNDRRLDGAGFVSLSPDGKYVAHYVDGLRGSTLMVNEVRGREYSGFLVGSRFVWSGPRTFHVMAGRGNELLAVTVEVVE